MSQWQTTKYITHFVLVFSICSIQFAKTWYGVWKVLYRPMRGVKKWIRFGCESLCWSVHFDSFAGGSQASPLECGGTFLYEGLKTSFKKKKALSSCASFQRVSSSCSAVMTCFVREGECVCAWMISRKLTEGASLHPLHPHWPPQTEPSGTLFHMVETYSLSACLFEWACVNAWHCLHVCSEPRSSFPVLFM